MLTSDSGNSIFRSFMMGGFECSTHRNVQGRRLDMIEATRHDEFALADYTRLVEMGMSTARDGVRWHLIEKEPGVYDFSSLEAQARAVRETGIQVIWDYFHYGYPDGLDIFSLEFIERFAGFSRAVTDFLKNETGHDLLICPVNEISFFAWIAGDIGLFYPYARRRGNELKRQMVKASIAAIDAARGACPTAKFFAADPAIHVLPPRNSTPSAERAAGNYRRAQFQALDRITGLRGPELGGGSQYLDILGLNYYSHNQWRHPSRRKVLRGHKDYRPLHLILQEYYERYRKPIFIAETGIEDERRPEWFRYICEEVQAARAIGLPIEGICLYPVVNHPGWDDSRHCHNGLWDYANDKGDRDIYQPLAQEIGHWQSVLK